MWYEMHTKEGNKHCYWKNDDRELPAENNMDELHGGGSV